MIARLCKETLGPLVLRLGLAVICLFHGFDKITGPRHEGGANWHWLKPPLPPPVFGGPVNPPRETLPEAAQLAIAWGEFGAGIALLLGVLTPLAALAAASAFVAESFFTPHWNFNLQNGFALFSEDNKFTGGYEYTLLIYVACAAVLLQGGGRLSVDRLLLGTTKPTEAAAAPPGTPVKPT